MSNARLALSPPSSLFAVGASGGGINSVRRPIYFVVCAIAGLLCRRRTCLSGPVAAAGARTFYRRAARRPDAGARAASAGRASFLPIPLFADLPPSRRCTTFRAGGLSFSHFFSLYTDCERALRCGAFPDTHFSRAASPLHACVFCIYSLPKHHQK